MQRLHQLTLQQRFIATLIGQLVLDIPQIQYDVNDIREAWIFSERLSPSFCRVIPTTCAISEPLELALRILDGCR